MRWRGAEELIKSGYAEGDEEGVAVLWMEWSGREKEEQKGRKKETGVVDESSRSWPGNPRTGRSLRAAAAHRERARSVLWTDLDNPPRKQTTAGTVCVCVCV